jgi:regulator of protease activity HflC (stomatin/prohibitin superfamily)
MYKITPPGLDDGGAPRRTIASLVGGAVGGLLELVGLRRPRDDDGTLGPRPWRRLGTVFGGLLLAYLLSTMIHVVPAGSVGVPVTLGAAGDPLDAGFHLTLPFTRVQLLSARTTSYTMAAAVGEGNRANIDDSVDVLGADGAAANVDSTVLFQLDVDRATEVYQELGTDYVLTVVRPSARTCLRSVFTNYTMIEAATTAWHVLEDDVTECMRDRLDPRGLTLQDFQLREVHLDTELQAAVSAKVAAEQDAARQDFELQRARKAAEITRTEAIATADSQQILACGGTIQTVEQNGVPTQVVIPNPVDECSQAQLTPEFLQFTYIQALKSLVDSPSNTTLILPFDQSLTPLINVGAGATTVTPPATAPGG